jgi:hypothetical protein
MLKPTFPNPTQRSQLLLQSVYALVLSMNASLGWAQTSVNPPTQISPTPAVRLQSLNPNAPGYRHNPEPQTHRWIGGGDAILELTKLCMKQVPPSLAGIFENALRLVKARGTIGEETFQAGLKTMADPNHTRFTLLRSDQIAHAFKEMGLTVDPIGFTAATYTVPGRSVFYAIKGSDSCVLDIKTPSASLEPILSWGGWSNKYYSSPGVLRKEVMFPRIVKEVDSINIRTLQATWQDDRFSSRFVMRGNYGVDSEQLSRLELEQEYGRMRVIMSPALPEDLKRLGMDSTQSEWPLSETLQSEVGHVIRARLDPIQNKPWAIRLWKGFESGPFEMTPALWPNAYLTEAAKKQMPTTMYAPSLGSPVALDKDFRIMFAAIPKTYRDPAGVDLLSRDFYLTRLDDQRSPYKEERGKGYVSIILLTPKPNEGLAKGLATYRLEGEPEGVRKTYEMVIKTKGALPDDKLLSFAQIRLMLPDELKADKPTLAKKESVKR